jgi:hypothetical protein
MLSMGREVACIKASFYIIAVSKMKCKGGKNKINGSGFGVLSCGVSSFGLPLKFESRKNNLSFM